jgi:hypothetical protein
VKRAPLTAKQIDRLPAACGRGELMRVFGIGKSRFNVLRQEGAFDAFLLVPAMGQRRYSGELLKAYLRGGIADPMRAHRMPRLRRAS